MGTRKVRARGHTLERLSLILRRTTPAMPTRTRTPNVSAAQWRPNGGALGPLDPTQPGANKVGANVFSIPRQRHRLPKAVFKQLEATIAKGQPLEPALADAV